MKVLIVDDEPRAREGMQKLLEHYAPEVDTIHLAENITEARNIIQSEELDVLFLDIEMSNGSGFDLLNAIEKPDFELVFVTAYEQYALKAFRFSALDYLLKPIDPEELMDCLKRIRSRLKESTPPSESWKTLLQQIQQNDFKKLALPDINGVTFLNVDEILHCSSDRNYTRIYCKDGKHHLISKTLKEVEESLNSFNFFRVHHSDLINLDYVSRFDRHEGCFAILSNGSKVAVSKRKRSAFLKALGL